MILSAAQGVKQQISEVCMAIAGLFLRWHLHCTYYIDLCSEIKWDGWAFQRTGQYLRVILSIWQGFYKMSTPSRQKSSLILQWWKTDPFFNLAVPCANTEEICAVMCVTTLLKRSWVSFNFQDTHTFQVFTCSTDSVWHPHLYVHQRKPPSQCDLSVVSDTDPLAHCLALWHWDRSHGMSVRLRPRMASG